MKNTNSNKPDTGKLRQSTLNRFIDLTSSDDSSDPDVQVAKAEEQKLREASDWTGVLSRDQFTDKETKVTNIAADLRVMLAEKVTVPPAKEAEKLVFFDPETYKGREQELMEEGKAVTQEQLVEYAKTVTEVRADINRRAETMEADAIQRARDETGNVSVDDIKLHRTYTPLKQKKSPEFQHQGVESGMRPDR